MVVLVVGLVAGNSSRIGPREVDGINLLEDFFELVELEGRLIEGQRLLVGCGLQMLIYQTFVFI